MKRHMHKLMIVRVMIVLAAAVPRTALAATAGEDPVTGNLVEKHITLAECIETGLQNNFSVRIMRNLEQQAVNNATRGNAGQLPTLGLNASYGGTWYDNRYHYPDGEVTSASSLNNNVQAGVDLNWTVFNGFSIRATYEKLQEMKIRGALDMRLTLEDFVASVASEYYHLIRQRVRLSNLRQTVSLSRERLRIVQESFHIGASSGLDYQQAQVDYNADTSDYLTQVELVRRSVINLNKLMALEDIERRNIPADTAIALNCCLDKEQLWMNTLRNNTVLLQAVSERTISELDMERVKSRNYPYLRLNAGYGYRQYWYTDGNYDRNNQFGPTLGASLGFALYDGGNRKREQANAKLTIENSRLRQEQLENSLRADLASLWMAYDNNLNLWDIEKSNLRVARSNFEIAMERYRLRELSGIELREAQLSLLKSEERLSTVEYNIKVCEISLLLLSGDILTSAL
ncbi:MAG: TolC family protein [Bacteroidales bacterium]|nr:TolC family protein [Bacteroidales bacterium]MDD5314949.1 TolC family protein [Bacteroidales bacterium]